MFRSPPDMQENLEKIYAEHHTEVLKITVKEAKKALANPELKKVTNFLRKKLRGCGFFKMIL